MWRSEIAYDRKDSSHTLPPAGRGFTVTSPLLAELVTEGDTFELAIENVKDALAAVVELYEDTGRELPPELRMSFRT